MSARCDIPCNNGDTRSQSSSSQRRAVDLALVSLALRVPSVAMPGSAANR